MRGIIWEEIRRVELVTARDSRVQGFVRWRDRHRRERLEIRFHERQAERAQLTALFGVPMEQLLTREAMLEVYIARHYTPPPPTPPLPPPTCLNCPNCARDRYQAGAYICWHGWVRGQRPKAIPTLEVCDVFVDRRPRPPVPTRYDIEREMLAWMAEHGLRFHAGTWKAYADDMQRDAGDWGFRVGTQWEQDVRDWITTSYGERFFVPQRWLVVTDRTGAWHYREVDGIERVDGTHAYVYEIKHNTAGYHQLAEEYLPLLQRAYPDRMFTPVEINSMHPSLLGDAYKAAPALRLLRALEERTMDGQYQVLWLTEIPQYTSKEEAV
jgi:hypothetical protein